MSKVSKFSNEELEKFIDDSSTWTTLAQKCGYKRPGNNIFTIRKELDKRGLSFNSKLKFEARSGLNSYGYAMPSKLKNILLKTHILENICANCGISQWQDKAITLQLDHINGDSYDNNVENLRLLCPNCHSKTDTWKCSKPKKITLCACGKEMYRTSKKCRSCTFEEKKSDKKRDISTNNRVYKINTRIFIDLVKSSESLIGIARKCGYKGCGSRVIIKHRIEQLELDTTHFNPSTKGKDPPNKISLEDILDNRVPYKKKLRKRLIQELNWDNCCVICGTDSSKCTLELDHIDGNHANNTATNLRILCPNCHSQTNTWCGKNKSQQPAKKPVKSKNSIQTEELINNDKDLAAYEELTNNEKSDKKYCNCGSQINKKHTQCNKCLAKNRFLKAIQDRPLYSQLLNDIRKTNYSATGRKYNVSDNCIRKWIKKYEMYGILD